MSVLQSNLNRFLYAVTSGAYFIFVLPASLVTSRTEVQKSTIKNNIIPWTISSHKIEREKEKQNIKNVRILMTNYCKRLSDKTSFISFFARIFFFSRANKWPNFDKYEKVKRISKSYLSYKMISLLNIDHFKLSQYFKFK
jgi:hypothetical protein